MLEINWGALTPEIFLKEYWQKKPLLIKNAFPNFVDPINADELAGLAMEEHIESRIISSSLDETLQKTSWQVSHGPFDDFSAYGEQGWTLLVQAVNNWSIDTHALINAINFLPSWRIDDVMVSFSTPKGGVGAHLDQYDVFIIQGQGKRHWQVGLPNNKLKTLLPHEDLKQVSSFTPIIDEITQPGDLLYIPPDHPHNGVSLENSLNFSIGFQAPNNQELFSALADKLIDNNLAEERFSDASRVITDKVSMLAPEDINNLKEFMLSQLNNAPFFNDFIGRTLTSCHHPLEILIPITPFTPEKIALLMQDKDAKFIAVSGIKALFIPKDKVILENKTKETPCLYINAESFPLSEETSKLGLLLANKKPLNKRLLNELSTCVKNQQLLTDIINKGFWYIE